MKNKSKQWKTVLAVVGCIALLVLAVSMIVVSGEKAQRENMIDAQYQRAFEDIIEDTQSLNTKLAKLSIASSPKSAIVYLMDIWRQTGDTEASIAAMPINDEITYSFMQLTIRLGDYCKSLANKLLNGEEISQEDRNNLKHLREGLSELEEFLKNIWNESSGYSAEAFENIELSVSASSGGEKGFIADMYARLTYDGPFSESTENKQPKGLSGQNITQSEAFDIARKLFEFESLAKTGDVEGAIPCYVFEGETRDKKLSLYITKRGGHLLYLTSEQEWEMSASPSDERYEELKVIAEQGIRKFGFPECEASYAQFYNGCAVINVAPVEKRAILYPDQIKVWVDIQTDEIVGIDAKNYLMNHSERQLEGELMSEEKAKSKVQGLNVQNTRLALIPKDSGEEVLCYEFKIKQEEDEFLYYINAKTGEEEDILLIIHTNDGTLTE